MQRFAAFDIDRTLYAGILAADFVADLIEHGVISSELPEVQEYLDTLDDNKLVAALQAGQNSGTTDFNKYIQSGIDVAVRVASNTNTEVMELFTKCWRDLGMTTIAISTSPYAVVKPFCDNVGPFEFVIAPMAQNVDGIVGPRSIIRASERDKGKWLSGLVEFLGLSLEGSVAIGDSMTDAPMLELVDRPIAYKPIPDLRELAEQNNWEIWE